MIRAMIRLPVLLLLTVSLPAADRVEIWTTAEMKSVSAGLASESQSKRMAGKTLGAWGNHSASLWRRDKSGDADYRGWRGHTGYGRRYSGCSARSAKRGEGIVDQRRRSPQSRTRRHYPDTTGHSASVHPRKRPNGFLLRRKTRPLTQAGRTSTSRSGPGSTRTGLHNGRP
jgi:hypothetical protein